MNTIDPHPHTHKSPQEVIPPTREARRPQETNDMQQCTPHTMTFAVRDITSHLGSVGAVDAVVPFPTWIWVWVPFLIFVYLIAQMMLRR